MKRGTLTFNGLRRLGGIQVGIGASRPLVEEIGKVWSSTRVGGVFVCFCVMVVAWFGWSCDVGISAVAVRDF